MFYRTLSTQLSLELAESSAVALLGPRQVGKTTLAHEVAGSRSSIYLDLESEKDRAKLQDAETYLAEHLDKLVILDEVHRAPGLFPVLRGLIDQGRRDGYNNGQYLLLGSASLDVLKQSGETLAGRIAYLELSGLTLLETGRGSQDTLWLRGGFPASFTASSGPASMRWRNNFIRTYLERDIPQFGPRIAAETLRRFWTMLAHHQGGLLNVTHLARNLGVDVKTAQSYIDLMCDLLLVRRLRPWHANLGKRLVKTPKVYVRDSGLVHALLNIDTTDALLSHMVVGASWEGYCIENILACAPDGVQAYFYRTSGGAEIDLLLLWPGNELWAIEIKRGHAPKVGRGFYSACEDLKPTKKIVVSSGQDNYPIGADIRVMSLEDVCQLLNGNN